MPMRITAKITGQKELSRDFRRAHKRAAIATKRYIEYYGDKIVSSIRRDRHLFTYKEKPIGGSFGVTRRQGALKRSLWAGKVVADKGALVQELGWGVPYGPYLEWGPERAKAWTIRPKGFRVVSPRSGGAVGLKYLRFKAKGKIVYAREARHRWKQSELRPHYGPAVEHWEKFLLRSLANVPGEALGERRGR